MEGLDKKFRKSLVKTLLPQIILTLAKEKPTYGYELIKKIRKTFGIYLGPSTIYPLLKELEEAGLLVSEWSLDSERPRKTYKSTNGGIEVLDQITTTMALLEVRTA